MCDCIHKLNSKALVKVKSPWHIVLFILNIFPGLGTLISSICGSSCNCDTVLVALLQMITAPIIVGWVWILWFGWLIYEKGG